MQRQWLLQGTPLCGPCLEGPCPRYPLAGGDPTPEHLPVSQPSTWAVPGRGAGPPRSEAEGRGARLHADLGEQPCPGYAGFPTQGSEETGLKRPREPLLVTLLPGSWAAPREALKEVRCPIRKGKQCRIHSCLQNISQFGQRCWVTGGRCQRVDPGCPLTLCLPGTHRSDRSASRMGGNLKWEGQRGTDDRGICREDPETSTNCPANA